MLDRLNLLLCLIFPAKTLAPASVQWAEALSAQIALLLQGRPNAPALSLLRRPAITVDDTSSAVKVGDGRLCAAPAWRAWEVAESVSARRFLCFVADCLGARRLLHALGFRLWLTAERVQAYREAALGDGINVGYQRTNAVFPRCDGLRL